MANKDIKILLLTHDIPQWKIAETIGYSEWWFSRMMRTEQPEDFKKNLRDVIEKMSEGQEVDVTYFEQLKTRNRTKKNKHKHERSDVAAERYANMVLDEIEERRINGGWGY